MAVGLGAGDINWADPGSVARHYGFSPDPTSRDYIFGNRYLGKFYNEAVKGGITSGGNKGILEFLRTPQPGQGYWDPKQFNLFQSFLNTGKVPKGLNPNWAIPFYDHAIRGEARAIHRKGDFFDSLGGKLLGGALTLGAGAIGGPLAGAVVGGATGAASGGLKGALIGGAGGYFAGSGGLQGAISKARNIFGGGGGLSSAAGAATSGGKNVSGILSSIGGFLGNNAGALITGGLNYLGQKKALDQQEKLAQQFSDSSEFRPYNVTGGLGSARFNGQNIVTRANGPLSGILGQNRQVMNEDYKRLRAFDRPAFTQDFYDRLYQLEYPDEQSAVDSSISRMYNYGNVGSKRGHKGLFDMVKALEARDILRRQTAFQAGTGEEDRLFNRYISSSSNLLKNTAIPDAYASIGLTGGNYASANQLAGANAIFGAGQDRADATAAFWSSLADFGGRAFDDFYGNRRQAPISQPIVIPTGGGYYAHS